MNLNKNILSLAEIESLVSGIDGNQDQKLSIKPNALPYSVTNQEPIDKFNFPYLDIVNQRFANYFNTSLSLFLRNSTEVVSGATKREKYSEFIDRFNEYASINVFSLKSLNGNGLIILDSSLVSIVVDHLFGGDGHFQQTDTPTREFTQTEQRIIKRVLNIIFEAQKKAWDLIRNIDFELTRTETKTQFARITSPHETVITNTFYIKISNVCSQMHLCIPVSVFNPIHDLLQNHVQNSANIENNQNWTNTIKQQIKSADIELTANLTTINTTLRHIKTIKTGDVLDFEMPKTISLTVNGLPIMECSFGQSNGKYALKIEKLLKNSLNVVKDSSNEQSI
ncbi:MAG: flagellar motor switch protein FliM [Pseudomonadota bacterium]